MCSVVVLTVDCAVGARLFLSRRCRLRRARGRRVLCSRFSQTFVHLVDKVALGGRRGEEPVSFGAPSRMRCGSVRLYMGWCSNL